MRVLGSPSPLRGSGHGRCRRHGTCRTGRPRRAGWAGSVSSLYDRTARHGRSGAQGAGRLAGSPTPGHGPSAPTWPELRCAAGVFSTLHVQHACACDCNCTPRSWAAAAPAKRCAACVSPTRRNTCSTTSSNAAPANRLVEGLTKILSPTSVLVSVCGHGRVSFR